MTTPAPRLVDPTHKYVGFSRVGPIRHYWYKDLLGNYVKYTNAPPDSPDFLEVLGPGAYYKNQPSVSDRPLLFLDNKKLHRDLPEDAEVQNNEQYSSDDLASMWYAVDLTSGAKFWLDSDVKENIALGIPYRLRASIANLPALRSFTQELFGSDASRDSVLALLLVLVDQGGFQLDELLDASVSDASILGNDTAVILGRPVSLDRSCVNVLSLLVDEDENMPLFRDESFKGVDKLSRELVYRTFDYFNIDPIMLYAWNVNKVFSASCSRLSASSGYVTEPGMLAKIPMLAEIETSRYFGRPKEVISRYVDVPLREMLISNMVAPEDPQGEEGREDEISKATALGSPFISSAAADSTTEDEKQLRLFLLRSDLYVP